jgi:toxin ParE1/3/4
MNYKISQEAKRDLESIWRYTYENWSLEQADRYITLILDEIDYLSKSPKSGKDYSWIRKGYFRSRVKTHFIFYKTERKPETIEVIRILHQKMDIESQLDG